MSVLPASADPAGLQSDQRILGAGRKEVQVSGDTLQDAQRTWNRVAEAYAHRRGRSDATKPAHDWIVEQAHPQPGQVILDLAAGAGDLGHRIASMVSPGGRIICSDLAPGMVDVARTIGNERDLDSVEYRVMDAQHMDLDDGSVDAIVCSAALMLMPDPDAVFAEARRVLGPGGVLAFSVFTTAAENPWVSVPVRVFVERGHIDPPARSGPGMFALGDRDQLRDRVEAAGFDATLVEGIDHTTQWENDDAVWAVSAEVNARTAPVVAAMGDTERVATRAAVLEALARYRSDDGSYPVPGRMWGVSAR